MLLGGIIDEHMEVAEGLDRLGDRVSAELSVPDVARDQDSLAALGFDKVLDLLGILGLFLIDDRDLRAFAGEKHRTGAADAAVAAGDDGDLVLEAVAALESRHVVRLRPHQALAAWLAGLTLRRAGGLGFGANGHCSCDRGDSCVWSRRTLRAAVRSSSRTSRGRHP